MIKEENKKRKRKLRWQIKLIIIIALIILYAFLIGTRGIFIREYKIETNKITNDMHGIKILQFSDLHYGSQVNDKMVNELVRKINDTKPDIVIFTGDLIDERHKLTTEEKEKITNQLSKINSELGKYYVTGEEDFDEATSILNLSGFTSLDNKEQLVYSNDQVPILLIGKNSVKTYFEANNQTTIFKILVLHDPNDIDEFKDYDLDVAIAGHTHNGQINIPKIKSLLINGKYESNYQKVNNIKLFINPGIGTSKINVRLFNHPTIYLYRLNKTSD